MELRPYQQRVIDEVRAHIRAGKRRILVVLPTGGGKTVISAFMAQGIAKRGKRLFFSCHRDFLVDQTVKTYEEIGLDPGEIVAGARRILDRQVQVASVQTLVRRLDRIPVAPDVMIWDEAHHAVAGSWDKIIRQYPDAIHVGLTATPERLDGRGLGTHFDVMVLGPSMKDLIRAGALSPFRVFSVKQPVDLSKVKRVGGDYAVGELEELFDEPKLVGDLVETWRKHANGMRSVYFGVSIKHSKHIAEAFNAAGIPARHLDADSSSEERSAAARDLATGALRVLSNCALFGEGYDLSAQAGLPVTVDCVGLARPTASLTLYLQSVGRALRPATGKTAVILDHVGNVLRHGMPDMEREWSLEAKPKKKAETREAVWVCEECLAANELTDLECSCCGAPKPRKERKDLEQVDGQLVELTADDVVNQMYRERDKKRRLGMAIRKAEEEGTLHAFEKVAKEFGYKRGWAWHRYRRGSAGPVPGRRLTGWG